MIMAKKGYFCIYWLDSNHHIILKLWFQKMLYQFWHWNWI